MIDRCWVDWACINESWVSWHPRVTAIDDISSSTSFYVINTLHIVILYYWPYSRQLASRSPLSRWHAQTSQWKRTLQNKSHLQDQITRASKKKWCKERNSSLLPNPTWRCEKSFCFFLLCCMYFLILWLREELKSCFGPIMSNIGTKGADWSKMWQIKQF